MTKAPQELPKFHEGIVVMLNSGGPLMTIDGLRQVGGRWMYHCEWAGPTNEAGSGGGCQLLAAWFDEDTIGVPK